MISKTFIINNEFFRTKGEVENKIQHILYNYEIGDFLIDTDFNFMADILKRHPRYFDKIGVGLKSIKIEKEREFNNSRCFILVRVDGSTTDFSYKKCLSPPTSQLTFFKKAGRNAITPQIIEFKNKAYELYADVNGKIRCPLTNVLIGSKDAQVDHTPPLTYNNIVSSFLNEFKIDINKLKFTGFGDNESKVCFCDMDVGLLFVGYHATIANLRIVSKIGNLRQKRVGVV